MPQWTQHSNVADVLSLGPRTAGRLMQVGVQTVADLLAAKPLAVAHRLGDERYSAETIELWQREAQLVLVAPGLPAQAVQVLAAIGYHSLEKIARSAPTELLGAIETASQQGDAEGRLEKTLQPSVSELANWIRCAQQCSVDRAA